MNNKDKGIGGNRLFKSIDYILIAVLCVIYTAVSFYNLGDTKAPQTGYDIAQNRVRLEFGNPVYVDSLWIYASGNEINGASDIIVNYTLESGKRYQFAIDDYSVFKWKFVSLKENVTSLVFSTECKTLTLSELGIMGKDGAINIGSDLALFDEQELIPERSTYKNGAYFDEIYHARTAYEYTEGKEAYEWTHPPLGKILISGGIKLFGMTPFGWRVVGNVFGILMIPLIYVLAKKMFGYTHIAFLGTVLLTFDFMHFTQSRVGVIDVYVTFFVLMMYLFMYGYFESTNRRTQYLSLLLSAVSFGLGAACKWSAVYAFLGIVIIFVMKTFSKKTDMLKTDKTRITVFALIAFSVSPICIYLLSYIPFRSADGGAGIRVIIENQKNMLLYHGGSVVGVGHEYASEWYTWPFMTKPAVYYAAYAGEGLMEAIYAFGNPVVWWGGFAALMWNIYSAFKYRDRKAIFLIIGYFSCLLPWAVISRAAFIYHYFPCVPFTVLLTANFFYSLYQRKNKTGKAVFAVYAAAAVILFIMFYPLLSGQPVNTDYADTYLEWFDSWKLIL